MSICKCKVAYVNVQVEINFAKAPTTSYNFKRSCLIFSEGCRAAWIDVHETQASRTKCRSSKTEMKLQCGFGPGRPFPTKCLSILENCRIFDFAKPLCVYSYLPGVISNPAFLPPLRRVSECDVGSAGTKVMLCFWRTSHVSLTPAVPKKTAGSKRFVMTCWTKTIVSRTF